MKKFQADIAEFEAKKEEELASIKELKQKETKRISQEKRVLERQNKAAQNMPNKKDREEIEALHKENAKLHEDAKTKESRYKLLLDKMKRQLDEALSKGSGLEKQVRELTAKLGEAATSQLRPAAHLENEVDSPARSTASATKRKEKENSRPREATEEVSAKPAKATVDPEIEAIPEGQNDDEDIKPDAETKRDNMQPVMENPHETEREGKMDGPDSGAEDDVGNEYDRSESKQIPQDKDKDAGELPTTEEHEEYMTAQPAEKARAPGKGREKDEEKYDMEFLPKYHAKNVKLVSQRVFNDGKISKQYENGKTEIIFGNGVKKESFHDGYNVIYFNNQDIKQVPVMP